MGCCCLRFHQFTPGMQLLWVRKDLYLVPGCYFLLQILQYICICTSTLEQDTNYITMLCTCYNWNSEHSTLPSYYLPLKLVLSIFLLWSCHRLKLDMLNDLLLDQPHYAMLEQSVVCYALGGGKSVAYYALLTMLYPKV